VLTLAGVAGAIGVTAVLAHDSSHRPRQMFLSAHGLMVRTTTGSYCVQHGNTGECGDSVYALRVRGLLPVDPGDRLTLFTHDRKIRRLHVSLLRADGNHWGDDYRSLDWGARAHRVNDRPSRWRFRLPAELGGANRLDISIRYGHGIGGSADFWAGLERGR
jgi:hypothetical protein